MGTMVIQLSKAIDPMRQLLVQSRIQKQSRILLRKVSFSLSSASLVHLVPKSLWVVNLKFKVLKYNVAPQIHIVRC